MMNINKKSLYHIYAIFFILLILIIGVFSTFTRSIKEEHAIIKNQKIVMKLKNNNAKSNAIIENLSGKIVLIVDGIENENLLSLNQLININHKHGILISETTNLRQKNNIIINLFFNKEKNEIHNLNFFTNNDTSEQIKLNIEKIINEKINNFSIYLNPNESKINAKIAHIFTSLSNKSILINLNPNFKSRFFDYDFFFNIDHVIETNDNIKEKLDKIAEELHEQMLFIYLKNLTFEQIKKILWIISQKEFTIISVKDLTNYFTNNEFF